MKWEKDLFGVALNSISIAKYTDGHKILLKAERNGKQWHNCQLEFDSHDEYVQWIEEVHEAGIYCHYGDAELVNRTLNYMRTGRYFDDD